MEANELRLGNFVIPIYPRHNEKYITVNSINLEEINSDFRQYSLVDLKPIKLTEEILLKCGFEDKTYKSGYIGKEFRSNMILDFVLTKPRKLYETQDYYVFELREHRIVPIKYLHQLQNIYFSITQQELEVNL